MWNSLIYYLKFSILIFVATVVSIITIPIMAVNYKNIKNGLMYSHIVKQVTRLLGITWHIRNKEILAEERGAIIIVNHQSSLDILCWLNIWPVVKKMAIVAKKEFIYMGPFGLAFYLGGHIFIDRKKTQEAQEKIKSSSKVFFRNKTKVLIFPEGTRNLNSHKLLPFKRGAFSLAIDCQVPIIPVVISPYYFLNSRKHIFNDGHVIVQCLEAVSTEGLTMDDASDLKDRIQNMMQMTFQKLADEIKIKYHATSDEN